MGYRYFDLKIQPKPDENTRVVCFSPNKRQEIKENEEKSPVKTFSVSPTKRKYGTDGVEYKINSRSKVARTKNMSFPWSKVPGGEDQ